MVNANGAGLVVLDDLFQDLEVFSNLSNSLIL